MPKTQKLKLKIKDADCSIISLYNTTAEQLGLGTEATYNCTKILVSQKIQDEIFEYYKKKQKLDDHMVGMLWLNYGPKVDDSLHNYEVIVQEGWYTPKEDTQ